MDLIVGVGEYAVSNRPEDVIKTFSLGTCVAIVFYCADRKLMAMAHVALPRVYNQDVSRIQKSKYADSAIDFLLFEMRKKGMNEDDVLYVHLIGGMKSTINSQFTIGEQNLAVLRNRLGELAIHYNDIETSDRFSRTVYGYIDNGQIEIIKYPFGQNKY